VNRPHPDQRLDVYLRGDRVGALERQGPTRYRFRYSEEVVERSGEGALVLSACLPARREPFRSSQTKPFFEGLLPEGAIRSTIARSFGLSEDNGFGLLGELGADCAGAVVILPPDAPTPTIDIGSVDWLDDDTLAQRVADLPRNPLGVGNARSRVRLSLAGVQPKLVVTRAPSGKIGQPTRGVPSTHIVKPPLQQFPDLVANELFCLRVARLCGLRVAAAETLEIAGSACLLVERWDRTIADDGRIARLHQEDFCQALGLLPAAKYEVEGGPSFPALVEGRRQLGGPALALDLNELVRALALNFLLGNADAHGKNYALLYDPIGVPRLAPLYDIVSTSVYPELQRSLAMSIGGIDDPDAIGIAAWQSLASHSGLGTQVPRVVQGFAERVVANGRAVGDASRAEGWHRPVVDEIVGVAERRAAQLET
jgi:serine/threonine-protein kinase HipA